MAAHAIEARSITLDPPEREWVEPCLFVDTDPPPISPDFLPPLLRDFCRALAEETETPIEMSIACVLGVLSTALSGKITISPKEGWEESVNTYWFIELPPGNMKSKVLNTVTKPLIEWEKLRVASMLPAVKEAESHRKTQEKIIEHLRRKTAIVSASEQEELIKEIANREANLSEVPVLPQIFANNVTPESLERFTYEQGGFFAVISDEGGAIETLTGLYSNGRANIDLVLKGIDGGEVRTGRKDRSIVMKPYLSFILCVQPGVREKMWENPILQGNGALERFLYVIPKSLVGYRRLNTIPMPMELRRQYSDAIFRLLDFSTFRGNSNPIRPFTLSLCHTASSLFEQFRQWLEPQLRPDGDLYHCQGWASKLPGYALRIAAVMHFFEFGAVPTISEQTMSNALHLAASLIEHSKAAFRYERKNHKTTNARQVFKWFIDTRKAEATRSELVTAMKNRFRSDALNSALDELIQRNILQLVTKVGNGTKPVKSYLLNPSIYTA